MNKVEDKFWICKDGSKIEMSEMDDNHLINAWRLFSKKKKVLLSYLEQGVLSRQKAGQLLQIEKRLGLLVPEMIKRGMHK